jgi:hypothetical protein
MSVIGFVSGAPISVAVEKVEIMLLPKQIGDSDQDSLAHGLPATRGGSSIANQVCSGIWIGFASVRVAIPYGAGIHLPAMGSPDDRREKARHLYRFLARQLFDFNLAILGHKLAGEH